MESVPVFSFPQKQAKKSVLKMKGTKSVRVIQDFRAVAENAPDIICRFDRELRMVYVNPAIETATGIPSKLFIGKNPLEVGMPKKFVAYWNKYIKYVFSTGKKTSLEFIFPTPDGERYYMSLVVPEYNEDGYVVSVLSISRDITEIKKLEKQKDEFIGLVSHELKTPLTILKAFTQLLERRVQKKQISKKEAYFIKNIVTQTDRLTKLVNDLLDVGRIAAGKLEFKKKNFDLMALLKKVVINFQYSIDSHNIILEGQISEKVFGDEDRLEQVLVNLIANGVKYSPKANSVIVKVENNKKEAVISVKDFGLGISEKDKKKLFERFYRSLDSQKTAISGFGLGLYISKQIIERHHGRIWVDSKAGQGTTFYFTIPFEKKLLA